MQSKVGKTGTKAQKLKFFRKKVEKGENEDEGTCTIQPNSSSWYLGAAHVHCAHNMRMFTALFIPAKGWKQTKCAFSVARVNWGTQHYITVKWKRMN